jgi:hypothetical protein
MLINDYMIKFFGVSWPLSETANNETQIRFLCRQLDLFSSSSGHLNIQVVYKQKWISLIGLGPIVLKFFPLFQGN